MGKLPPFSFLSILCLLLFKPTVALPLSTSSRWIVDEDGARVKLACVNWLSHLEAVVAEGLSQQPVDMISRRIVSMGFNCVRLTWPHFLVTNESLASLTVRQSFERHGLLDSLAGFQVNNPSMVDLPLVEAYQKVLYSLRVNKVMVILDNHISKPGWCCSSYDVNGFFADQYFNPDLWVQGLTRTASLFHGVSNVVGMSLRNELRGPKQNVKNWYRSMQKGAEAVHLANPDVLVILSGLSYDTDLSFLTKQALERTFIGKLVFEMHWYGFSDGREWETGNPNQVCGRVVDNIMRRGGVLLEQEWPLFVSDQFGVDQGGTDRYLNSFFGLAAEMDIDWTLWTLVGSYYVRRAVIGLEETYGLLNWNWCEIQNSSFLQRISALQSPFQGPDVLEVRPHTMIFHPSTGLCVVRKSAFETLRLGPCSQSEAWSYTPQKTLIVKGTYFCLQAVGVGKPVKLAIICNIPGSQWEAISDSKTQLSTELEDGTSVCLDVDSSNNIVSDDCKCLSRDRMCDPGSQWFKIVNSTQTPATSPLLQISSNLDFKGARDASEKGQKALLCLHKY